MKNLFFFFAFVLLATLSGIAQTSAHSPLTVGKCNGVKYEATSGEKLDEKFGANWKLLLPANPSLKKRITKENPIPKLRRHDALCIPYGMQVGEATAMPPFPTAEDIAMSNTDAFGGQTKISGPPLVITLPPANAVEVQNHWYENPWTLSLIFILLGLLGLAKAYRYTHPKTPALKPTQSIPPTIVHDEDDLGHPLDWGVRRKY